MSAMKKLLFVCSGNAGRSPAAQYLAAEYIRNHDIPIEVQSRGTNVRDRSVPDIQLVTAIPATRSHVPTALEEKAIEWADLILTMNRQHKQIVTAMVPSAANKTYCLYEYAEGTTSAVVDPGDYGQEDYEIFLEEMKRLVQLSINKFTAPQSRPPALSGSSATPVEGELRIADQDFGAAKERSATVNAGG
jgi:protein arginine phosphatase